MSASRTTMHMPRTANDAYIDLVNDGLHIFDHPEEASLSTRHPVGRVHPSTTLSHQIMSLDWIKWLVKNADRIVQIYNNLANDPQVKLDLAQSAFDQSQGRPFKTQTEIYFKAFQLKMDTSPLAAVIYNDLVDFDSSSPSSSSSSSQPTFLTGIQKVYYEKCFSEALEHARGDRQLFEETLKENLQHAVKTVHNDRTETPYQILKYRPRARYEPNWDEIMATAARQRVKIIDFSNTGRPPKEYLAQIPAQFDEVIFSSARADETGGILNYFAWLPPHIKKITYPLRYGAVVPLCFPFVCSGESVEDHNERFMRGLPFTVKEVVLNEHRNESININEQPTVFPASYQAVFNRGFNSDENLKLDPCIRGMRELLRHYLGIDARSNSDGVARTWLRCLGREHRQQVEDVIREIDSQDLQTPLDILAALKAIEPENPRGGLRMRIHFLNHILSLSPAPQASSSVSLTA